MSVCGQMEAVKSSARFCLDKLVYDIPCVASRQFSAMIQTKFFVINISLCPQLHYSGTLFHLHNVNDFTQLYKNDDEICKVRLNVPVLLKQF